MLKMLLHGGMASTCRLEANENRPDNARFLPIWRTRSVAALARVHAERLSSAGGMCPAGALGFRLDWVSGAFFYRISEICPEKSVLKFRQYRGYSRRVAYIL